MILEKAKFWEKHNETPLNARQRLTLNKLLVGFVGKLKNSLKNKTTSALLF
ncbi:hypothetical protein [Aquimarina sp. RZ0]|uniref:hypothetical protein n=1 Tax=Aquimarina sp. RZ0 TaxID=2607730 RepID=UPI001CB6DB42|nr:hypothetical protein [Aquimarina sp. RZ0]